MGHPRRGEVLGGGVHIDTSAGEVLSPSYRYECCVGVDVDQVRMLCSPRTLPPPPSLPPFSPIRTFPRPLSVCFQ